MTKRSIAILAAAVIAAIPVAAVTYKTAQLEYNNIKITLNGAPLTPKDANGTVVEPFIIDGTTYLPVRAVSNALGLQVGWDESTSTVQLSNGQSGGMYDLYQSANIKTELIPSADGEIYIRATNLSGQPVAFTSDAAFMNGAGKLLDTNLDDAYLAPYGTGLIHFSYFADEPFSRMLCCGKELSDEFEATYCLGDKIAYQVAPAGGSSCNITFTNQYTETLEMVADVLYMKDGAVVCWDFIYPDDSIPAGASITEESRCYSSSTYDSVLVFVEANLEY